MDERILELLRGAPLIDGHNDLLYALREIREDIGAEPDIAEHAPPLQTDLPRLELGGVGAQFWSVYVPSHLPPDQAVTQTLEQVESFYELVHRYPGRLEQARTASDVERIAAKGRVASIIGVEGGHSIGNSLGTLRILARLGAGYMTLTHNDDTDWADSATGDHPHGGLTTFGEDVVRELNRSGVLVDLSHVSDDTMRQAIEVSEAPVIFSHSSARALCDVTRNVPDDVLELVRQTGAVVMVTFVPSFTAPEGAELNRRVLAEAKALRVEHADDPEALRAAMDEWWDSLEEVPATVSQVADHIDHVRDVAGVDHIGVGGDYDGAAGMPAGLEDVAGYPTLFAELAARGYTDDELQRIAGRNVLRVMREAELVATQR
ncbi:MAG: dipeptidase [Actinomycetota bacterium]